jgi:hypothetical protein
MWFEDTCCPTIYSMIDPLWRPTSPGNEDVLICINAPFMTQRVLKPWWQWTYQNSTVKRAAARAIPGWVTSWEVWYGEPKADSIVSLGVGRYTHHPIHVIPQKDDAHESMTLDDMIIISIWTFILLTKFPLELKVSLTPTSSHSRLLGIWHD